MFLVAKGLIISNGSNTKTHSGVKTEFSKMFIMTGIFNQEMFTELSRSETLRNQADYDVTIEFTKKVAKERIESAIKFINNIKNYIDK